MPAPHPRVGIERISAYPCSLSLDMRTLAEARGSDPKHPLEDLWVDARSINPPWEDPVTMAVNAALRIVDDTIRDDIELVIVGTESAPDFGKPISTYVQRYCEIGQNCRNFESKHACYGGTSALMMAAHWVASGVSPGKKALVVTTDQSRTHLGKPWEYVLGAASAAMVVSDQPDFLELELRHNGYWTQEIADTYRPTSKNEVGHADTSLYGYLEAVEGAYDHYMEKAGHPDYDQHFAKNIYHVPFGAITFRAHRALTRRCPSMKGVKGAALREHFERKSKAALTFNRLYGGTYTSATFIAMLGMVDQSTDLAPGDRMSVFAYGSGSCAEFYSVRIGDKAKAIAGAADLRAALSGRRAVTVDEYEAVEMARAGQVDNDNYETDKRVPDGLWESHYEGRGRLVLDGVDDWERRYRLS